MERLPYIDQHSRIVAADRERTWAALLRSASGNPDDLSTLPHGFGLDEAEPPRRLTLTGANRITSYGITWRLEEVDAHRTRLTAESRAAFHGRIGKLYRALVIGTGAHAFVVRRLLRRTAAAAARS
ncbi:hypothetical protein FOH10_30580 [Nocardia otitidiscaviarum]|uniref:DUF2867 domain-containing protein n=1 Tax=Nocardia otitidiscaviarum TaxID=1823 RepID=A0A516NU33_9NOCA|nr:hypothetical protein [Nocardia otitidiscaviarum]MCP9621797.1 hypothetical protein [Nocardia otitidiscaviarum]QDP82427.1 hypothetical protein FOH10_30580 [Nocardia otitidiscaviarum]